MGFVIALAKVCRALYRCPGNAKYGGAKNYTGIS